MYLYSIKSTKAKVGLNIQYYKIHMKKLPILLAAALCFSLMSCKTRMDSMASNSNDDVYFDPAKDPKPAAKVVAAQDNSSYQQNNSYNPNQGRIAATHADSTNPNYRDPKFNYDDYYDNAYASRISRFQNPIYGTGYYDSYYTNSYFYNGNPAMYGSSIYNYYPSSMYSPYGYGSGMSVGIGYSSGFYSPSSMFYSSYYNPYYGMGSGFGMSYGMGYGYGSPYYGMGMGYGYGSPYYGMGYGMYGYDPYSMGYMNGYYSGLYSSGYGAGYVGGYSNSYDYNSNYYGPRSSHNGGIASSHSGPRGTNSGSMEPGGPRTGHREMAPSSPAVSGNGASPMDPGRFNHVSISRENMSRITETRSNSMNPGNYNPGRPAYNGGEAPQNTPRNNTFNQNAANGGSSSPRSTFGQPSGGNTQPVQQEAPHRGNWGWSGGSESSNPSGGRPSSPSNGNSNGGFSQPSQSSPRINSGGGGGNWGGGTNGGGGGGRSGGGFGGGSSSGGGGRPRR